MSQLLRFATAFAAGALTMYMFDPVAGRRRRALARDQATAAGHDVEAFARNQARHATDRLHGAAARMHAREPADDQQLRDRIRSKLGHLVAQPGKVEVHVENGLVTLNGTAHLSEAETLVTAISQMLGVERVDNRLDAAQAAPASESRH